MCVGVTCRLIFIAYVCVYTYTLCHPVGSRRGCLNFISRNAGEFRESGQLDTVEPPRVARDLITTRWISSELRCRVDITSPATREQILN